MPTSIRWILLLAALGLFAWVVVQFLQAPDPAGGGGEEPATTQGPKAGGGGGDAVAPATLPAEPSAPALPGPVAAAEPDADTPPAPPAWVPPLSDVLIHNVVWEDLGGMEALLFVTAQAGKNVRFRSPAKQRLERVKVSAKMEEATASMLLDLILLQNDLRWNIDRGDVLIFIDDD